MSRAAGGGRRRLGAIFLGFGAAAVLAGAVALGQVLAPMYTAPTRMTGPPQAAAVAGPSMDTATVVEPEMQARPAEQPRQAAGPAQSPVDGVWFLFRVPALGYSAVVREGVSPSVLASGPGHYPDTPWPGQPGNVGMAGHNGFWLSFSHLAVGDRVEIQTQHALYVYAITGSQVVDPGDRTVLAPTPDNRLTMTTCYPLWAGLLATQRLIFTARPIGGVA
jgi:LPXTG-site transpeptidase (sortase) family protein